MADFDHLTLDFMKDREASYTTVRRTLPPVFYTESNEGHWVITSYEAAREVLMDEGSYSCAREPDGSGGRHIPSSGFVLSFAEMDPPEHTTFRKALWARFSRNEMEKLRPLVELVTTSCLDRIVEKRDFDVISDLSGAVPSQVMLPFIGFELDQSKELMDAVHTTYMAEGGKGSATEAGQFLGRCIMDVAERKQREPEDDTLMSYLVRVKDPHFDEDNLVPLIMTLILAGFDTTNALISFSVLHLDEHRDIRQRLIDDPSLIPAASEEFVRYSDPTGGTTRKIVRDVVVGGVQMQAGDRVFLALPAADRDARYFENPNDIDIDRTERHLAYGIGMHLCLGIWMARLENTVVLRQLLERIPDYSLLRNHAQPKVGLGAINGWVKMPATTNR